MAQIPRCCGCGAALIQLLAWEFPYAAGVALKRRKKEKEKKKKISLVANF